MRLFWGFVVLFVVLLPLQTLAQEGKTNAVDKGGKPHGLWYTKHPERMGEPAYTEFGYYDHGRKYGLWHILSSEGTLMSTERFKNNALDGESLYYENGKLATTGTYRGLNPDQPYDTIWVVDPVSGNERQVVVSTEMGSTRHGTWRYYNTETGRLIREEEYQVDDLISHRDMGVSKEDSAAYLSRAERMPHNLSPRSKRIIGFRKRER